MHRLVVPRHDPALTLRYPAVAASHGSRSKGEDEIRQLQTGLTIITSPRVTLAMASFNSGTNARKMNESSIWYFDDDHSDYE